MKFFKKNKSVAFSKTTKDIYSFLTSEKQWFDFQYFIEVYDISKELNLSKKQIGKLIAYIEKNSAIYKSLISRITASG
jgi:hypothetical protein